VRKRYFNYASSWQADGHELREYFDTDDPYQLIKEAREARALLDEKFCQGAEFANEGYESLKAYDDPSIKYLCSIGAVFHTQGHQVFECNLINQLNKSATDMHGMNDGCSDPNCGCDKSRTTIVDVNDSMGKEAALEVFDHTIAEYQAQIDYAELCAAAYTESYNPYTVTPFVFSNTAAPAIGCGPKGCTVPAPVKQEVPVA
jgi:hypothetical protein